ncbi:MAG: DUF4328 domain-containing protein [Pseudomonadota bacterium]
MRYDLARLTPWCIAITVVFILCEMLFGAHSVWMLLFLRDILGGTLSETEYQERANLIDELGGMVGSAYVATTLIAYLVNGMWIWKASHNAAMIDPDLRRISAGWAFCWFLIPIANFWMPFKAMKQTWNSTHFGASADMNGPVPLFMSVWWFCWIVSSVLGQASGRMARNSNDIETLVMTTWMDVVGSPFSILAAILFLRILRDVSRVQRDHGSHAEIFA